MRQAATSVQAGGAAAEGPDLEEVFRAHHRQVFQSAMRITGNASDAEDVLQTVFLRLVRRDGGHGLNESPSSYLHRAAVNAALDVMRRRRNARATPLDDVAASLRDRSTRPQDDARLDVEIGERVREALGDLNPRTAEVFALRYFEGLDNHEIATLLGTSKSTVAVMLHRARLRLREAIRELAGEMP